MSEKSMKNEKLVASAMDLLVYAYEAFEQVTDPHERLDILREARNGADMMFDSICEMNPSFSLAKHVELMDLGFKAVPPDVRERVKSYIRA